MKRSYFDVVNEDDQLVGVTASYDEVHAQGLWHRGVHIIIYTPDKQIVMQKRAPSLAYHPDEVEISVGGGVEVGETPQQAVIREVQEELGISISAHELRFIGKTKFNHPTKTFLNRNFIYSYAACIPASKLKFIIHSEETSSAFLMSEKALRASLLRHRIRNVGRITSQYAYWKYMLDAI